MGICDTDEKLEWLYFSFAARVRFTSTYPTEGGGDLQKSWSSKCLGNFRKTSKTSDQQTRINLCEIL